VYFHITNKDGRDGQIEYAPLVADSGNKKLLATKGAYCYVAILTDVFL